MLMQMGASCRPPVDREMWAGCQCCGCLVGLWVVRLGTQEGQALGHVVGAQVAGGLYGGEVRNLLSGDGEKVPTQKTWDRSPQGWALSSPPLLFSGGAWLMV